MVASTCWDSASVRLTLLTSAAAVYTGLDGQLDARPSRTRERGRGVSAFSSRFIAPGIGVAGKVRTEPAGSTANGPYGPPNPDQSVPVIGAPLERGRRGSARPAQRGRRGGSVARLAAPRESLVVALVAPGQGRLQAVAPHDLVPLALFRCVRGVDDRAEIQAGLHG